MNKGDATTGGGKDYGWRKRPRAFKPKVKTGCRTCKIRRIKCDEEKPACLKCRSTGRQCDGYDDGESRTPTLQTDAQSSPPLLSSLRTPSPAGASPGPRELTALQFFHTRTVAQLSSYSASELWNRYVLQLSLIEPSIYHAAAALGGLHRWCVYEEGASVLRPDAFIFAEYNKAIYHLLHPAQSLSESVVLVACYVLSSIEALYGDYRSSFQHVASGIRLLCAPDGANPHTYPPRAPAGHHSSEREQIVEILLTHFAQLDLQASTFHPEWVPSMTHAASISPAELNVSISSLEEARLCLAPALLQVMAFKRHGEMAEEQQPADKDLTRSRLEEYLRRWLEAVEIWLRSDRAFLTQEDCKGALFLRVLCLTGYIMLAVPRSADEIMYDSLSAEFRYVVELSSALVSLQERAHESIYSSEIGILPGLYLTGTKCRDPILRRRALALLTSCRRREGVWDSRAAAKVVSRVITLEEEGTTVQTHRDVLEKSRLRDTWLQAPSNADRHALLISTRRRQSDAELEVIEDHIEW